MAAEEYDMDVPGQEFGQSILARAVAGFGRVKVKSLLETCMVEVERHSVILEN